MVVRLTGKPALTDAYLIVQREAAERFAGYPYNSETVRSLSLKPWWHAEILRRLRRTDFEPVPRVDTVLLWLMRRDRPLLREAEENSYLRFVESQLGAARTVRASLRSIVTPRQARRLAQDLRFPLDAPPGALSLEQWLGVYRFLALDRWPGVGQQPASTSAG